MAQSLLLFDGVCGLCNRAVDFLIRHDRRQTLLFAPLQSELGRALVARHGGNPDELSSLVLVRDRGTPAERAFVRSRAVLLAAAGMGGIWKLAHALRIIPPFLSDFLYAIIARNRYRLFGKHETCRIPSPEERARFLA